MTFSCFRFVISQPCLSVIFVNHSCLISHAHLDRSCDSIIQLKTHYSSWSLFAKFHRIEMHPVKHLWTTLASKSCCFTISRLPYVMLLFDLIILLCSCTMFSQICGLQILLLGIGSIHKKKYLLFRLNCLLTSWTHLA